MADVKKHAYLILAHSNFYNLEKLLVMLDDERNDIYIHLDKKVRRFNFDYYKRICVKAKVQYTRRINVRWGHQSLVLAELALFDMAYKNGPYHYYHLISGSDLPLKTQDVIHEFFANKTETYLHCNPEVTDWNRQRMSIYHFIIQPRNRFEKMLKDRLGNIQFLMHVDRLNRCKMPLLKGWEWGSLPHSAVQCLITHKKAIIKFTRLTLCSDEIYKQTFIGHYVGNLSADDQHFILWNNVDRRHPHTFTCDDFEMLRCSQRLFARKFDENVDRKIIDKVYNHIIQQQLQKTGG